MTEAAAQAQSLTTGEDTRPKRRADLVSKAAEPNRKREGGHVWLNATVIGFCIFGLVSTLRDQYRGDYHMFKFSFAICIGVSGAEIILNILLMILSGRCSPKNDGEEEQGGGGCKKCTTRCVAILVNLIYIIGCCVCFGLLVATLVSSMGIAPNETFGCANGFGCANIMAICACILYGLRVLLVAMCLPCLICTGVCACSACCAAAATGGDRPLAAAESGQAQQQQQLEATQNSTL